jgi:MarR family transcriptional regulator, organic hydroperoxide resistance regulator
VTRRRDSDDERRVLVALTTAGENLEDQVADVSTRLVASLGLNATESRQLRRLLGSLLERLDGELTQ